MTEQALGSDLHTRIREALQERIRIANLAASESGRWSWEHSIGEMCNDPTCPGGVLLDAAEDGRTIGGRHVGTVVMEVHGYDIHEPWQGAAHIAANDPASTIRRAEAGLRTLDRHAPEVVTYAGEVVTYAGGLENVECRACNQTCPCEDVRDLADGEGIEQ